MTFARVRLLRFESGCDRAPHVYRLNECCGRFAVCLGRTQIRFGKPRLAARRAT